MLKLLKHDIKESAREMLILNGSLIALSLIGLAAIRLEIYFLLTFGVFLWTAVFYAVLVIVLRNIIKSFHTNLFTSRGYLTLTTPVSIDKILLSKILVNMLWIVFTIVSVASSVLIILESLISSIFLTSRIFAAIWAGISENPLLTFKVIAYSLGFMLSFIMMLLFVLVLTNIGRFKRHKMIIGTGIYILLSVIVSQITFSINNIDISFALSLVFSVAIYFASRFLIISKLELE